MTVSRSSLTTAQSLLQYATLGLVASFVLLFLGIGLRRAAGETAGTRREFLASDQSGQIILTLLGGGASSGLKHTYRLYGDGRLDMRLETVDGQLRDGRELYLGRGEIDDLVRRLVETGVLECDSEELRSRFRETAGAVPILPDSGTLKLTVNLDRYVSAAGDERTPFTHSLRYQDAKANLDLLQRSSMPVFSELEGLAEVQQDLYEYWKLAKRGRPEEER